MYMDVGTQCGLLVKIYKQYYMSAVVSHTDFESTYERLYIQRMWELRAPRQQHVSADRLNIHKHGGHKLLKLTAAYGYTIYSDWLLYFLYIV